MSIPTVLRHKEDEDGFAVMVSYWDNSEFRVAVQRYHYIHKFDYENRNIRLVTESIWTSEDKALQAFITATTEA